MRSFEGKVGLVTGGGSGIGRPTSQYGHSGTGAPDSSATQRERGKSFYYLLR